jgi:SPASM domain peptide maturase of grasp-with-spasm system
LKRIIKILADLDKSRIRNVEIYLKDSTTNEINEYVMLANRFKIIGTLVVHSSNRTLRENYSRITFTPQQLSSSNCCGRISKESFQINVEFYLEGLKKNTCLNRKITVSEKGEIKNCPSMIKSFGNIKHNTIESIIDKKQFTEYWSVNKDKISVCKDCEFRRICSDCRAYVNGKYDKPLHCDYNPYI